MPRRTKGQHFLLSAAARTLSLATVLRMSDADAEAVFAAIRWPATDGRPVCPKTAFVLAHKIREAMAASMKGAVIGGVGHTVEVDGCYVGGHIRPENEKKDRKDRRLAENQTGKCRVVVAMRERGGRTLTAVFSSEAASVAFIKARVDGATTVHADEAADWNALHARCVTKRINHQEAYSLDGACTNEAESFFSRIRRAEIGHHHHISGAYLARYAREAAFREDHRRTSNGEQLRIVVGLVTTNSPSVDFCGYWQRSRRAA